MAGETRADILGGAREALLTGLADALAGMHRQEQALRERLAGEEAKKPAADKHVADKHVTDKHAADKHAAGKHAADKPAEEKPGAPRVAVSEGGEAIADLLYDIVRLELRVIDQLTTLSLHNADRLVTFMREQGLGQAAKRAPAPVVRLAGKPGERAAARFVIDNPSPRSADVVVRLSDLDAGGGAAPLRAEAEITPARARLAPGASLEVSLALDLDARFAPQTRYQGEVEITSPGRSRRALPLVIEVIEVIEVGKAAGKRPARKRAKTAAKVEKPGKKQTKKQGKKRA